MQNDPRLNSAPPIATPPVSAAGGSTPVAPVVRAKTSLGEVGSLIEKFSSKGTPALLHNEEGVVNLEQLNNIARGSKNSGIESALSGMQGMVGKQSDAPGKSESGINVEQLTNIARGSKNSTNDARESLMQSFVNKQTGVGVPKVAKEPPAATSGITTMMNNIRSYTGNMQASFNNQKQSASPNFDFAKSLEGIKTKVSSVNTPKVDYNPNEYVNSTLKTPTPIEEPKTSATPSPAPQQLSTATDSVTIKDLNEQLARLNTGIMQLVQHSAKSVDLNEAQIRATKSLSGNKFA
jgi:hypothetical protein